MQATVSNFTNLHIFNLTDVGNFGSWICKIESLFYFSFLDAFCAWQRIFCSSLIKILYFFWEDENLHVRHLFWHGMWHIWIIECRLLNVASMIKQANTKDAKEPSLHYVGITFFAFLDRKLHFNWSDANKPSN